jgi:hypothetical protein
MPGTTTLGLADWHVFVHTDGSRTALKQTSSRLLMVIARMNGHVSWRRYADVHGMILDIAANANTIEQAFIDCENC